MQRHFTSANGVVAQQAPRILRIKRKRDQLPPEQVVVQVKKKRSLAESFSGLSTDEAINQSFSVFRRVSDPSCSNVSGVKDVVTIANGNTNSRFSESLEHVDSVGAEQQYEYDLYIYEKSLHQGELGEPEHVIFLESFSDFQSNVEYDRYSCLALALPSFH